MRSDAWTGENAGAAIQGFVKGALAKSQEGGECLVVCDVFGNYCTSKCKTIWVRGRLWRIISRFRVGLWLINRNCSIFRCINERQFLVCRDIKYKSVAIHIWQLGWCLLGK